MEKMFQCHLFYNNVQIEHFPTFKWVDLAPGARLSLWLDLFLTVPVNKVNEALKDKRSRDRTECKLHCKKSHDLWSWIESEYNTFVHIAPGDLKWSERYQIRRHFMHRFWWVKLKKGYQLSSAVMIYQVIKYWWKRAHIWAMPFMPKYGQIYRSPSHILLIL